jgi:hypothetical protein
LKLLFDFNLEVGGVRRCSQATVTRLPPSAHYNWMAMWQSAKVFEVSAPCTAAITTIVMVLIALMSMAFCVDDSKETANDNSDGS